ncbi:peptidase C14 [Limnoraphis robusta Tam1]|uniref:Peptidase C14 n=1 Tax=Limnoraphis robusta CCNP1315 TaxID=3110306 RepID=A0ABU5U1F1_9CYAN|nr:peptidase C14 [Limnoraphis robusta]MEA5501424.1 peptidase C14 [Limnoraphis robusta BA-68 BA1]MEA5520870.1 peptidase C14 [Limnoraphis robusta CCNP1315]MEA5541227.1 peptidase C14 [Limnoraphis robusta Tam1]MEA5544395.1 peptidase C14 [Limnoraphis robusta CCNP1324]
MKHHACITIGINQYQYLQPLSYAQRDAEALHSFLVEKAGFSPDQSLLMSDTSPEVWGIPTYPNRDNLDDWIDALCKEQLHSGDQLWCFFSGYALTHEGQDYLMPIDSNPANIEATGLSIKSLFEKLKQAPTSELLVLLDINRSQGARAGTAVGAATMELANQMAIPTLLSCRPDQVSRETSALRHGFFTAAILEALNSGECKTIQSLCHFLSNRLPQLTDQHLRPKQNPVFVLNPAGKIDQIILPDQLPATVTMASHNGSSILNSASEHKQNGAAPKTTDSRVKFPLRFGSPHSNKTPEHSSVKPTPTTTAHQSPNSTPAQIDPPALKTSTKETMSDRSFLQQLILWSGATALLLLLGVFYTNKSIFLGQKTTGISSTSPIELIDNPSQQASPSKPNSSSSSSANQGTTAPENQLDSQTLLERSKASLQNASASSFSNAIVIASQIPQRDPLYPSAQENIERWSQTILDIAEARAQTGKFSDALAAAKLVPQTNRQIYQQAQLQIQKWEPKQQQIQQSFARLKAAQTRIKPGQASSYSDAINEARKIKPDEASYQQAQQSISQWSADILKVAQSRAQNKQFESAIQAAQLVPVDTSSHAAAQKAIASWQTQLKSNNKN